MRMKTKRTSCLGILVMLGLSLLMSGCASRGYQELGLSVVRDMVSEGKYKSALLRSRTMTLRGLHPELRAEYLLLHGIALDGSGRPSEAQFHYDLLCERYPDSPEAEQAHVRLALMRGKEPFPLPGRVKGKKRCLEGTWLFMDGLAIGDGPPARLTLNCGGTAILEVLDIRTFETFRGTYTVDKQDIHLRFGYFLHASYSRQGDNLIALQDIYKPQILVPQDEAKAQAFDDLLSQSEPPPPEDEDITDDPQDEGEILYHANLDDSGEILIPTTLEEVYQDLDRGLSERAKEILSKPSDLLTEEERHIAFFTLGHFGLGMWMRNNWGLWSGGPLADHFHAMGIFHPDDMTGIIFKGYYARIDGEDFDLAQEVKKYQQYWRQVSRPKPMVDESTGHEIGILEEQVSHMLPDGTIVHVGEDKETRETWLYTQQRGWFRPAEGELEGIEAQAEAFLQEQNQ